MPNLFFLLPRYISKYILHQSRRKRGFSVSKLEGIPIWEERANKHTSDGEGRELVVFYTTIRPMGHHTTSPITTLLLSDFNGKNLFFLFLLLRKGSFFCLNSKIEQNIFLNFKNHMFYLAGPVISGFEDGFVLFIYFD